MKESVNVLVYHIVAIFYILKIVATLESMVKPRLNHVYKKIIFLSFQGEVVKNTLDIK